MGRAVGTVSFFESFYGRLVLEGCTFVNGLSGQGRFHCHCGISQWPLLLPRVNTALSHRSFLCRSYAEHQGTHSAHEHRGLQRDSLAKLNRAACPRQAANRFGDSNGIKRITELDVRPKGGQHQSLPFTFMLGYTGLNCLQSKYRARSRPCNRQASASVSRPRPSVVRWLRAPG